MRAGALVLGALIIAGAGLLATFRPPGPLPPGRVVVAAAPQRSSPIVRDDHPAWPRPAQLPTEPGILAIAGEPNEVPAPTGYLDDAAVENFHRASHWDGGANPSIWATPAEFSDTD